MVGRFIQGNIMRKYLTTLLLIGMGFGQKNSISDGPYIFIEKGKLIEKRILNNEVTTRTLDQGFLRYTVLS